MRSRRELYAVRLPPALLARSTTLVELLAAALDVSRTAAQSHAAPFEFRNVERRFAEVLLRRKPNLWVFRSHQQRFCGDFVVVDMSSPRLQGRRVWALDLKQGASLRLGGGGAGVQFRNVALALRQITERTGILAEGSGFELASGEAGALLRFLGVRGRSGSERTPLEL